MIDFAESTRASTEWHSCNDFSIHRAEASEQNVQEKKQAEAGLGDLFLVIDRLPRRRLTKEEIDDYIFQERSSWD